MARDYVKRAWVNEPVAVLGDPELDAVGMNHFEDAIYNLDTKGKPYDSLTYYRPELVHLNTNEIMLDGVGGSSPLTQAGSGWSTTSCTTSQATGTFCHAYGVAFTESDNTASNCNGYRSITAMDLTKFSGGDTSSTSDYIVSVVWVQDVAKVNVTAGNGIMITLGTDISNQYRKYFNTQGDGSALVTGWNVIWAKKSDFTTSGSPNWNNVTWAQLGWVSLANASGKTVEFHTVRLVRKNQAGTAPSDKQVSHDNGTTFSERFVKNSWNFPILIDKNSSVNDLAMTMIGNTGIAINSLQMTQIAYYDFYSLLMSINKLDGYTPSVTWYVDANNYVELAVKSNVFTVNYCLGGSVTTLTKNLRVTLAAGSISYMIFQRMGNKIRCRFESGDTLNMRVIGYTTGFSDSQSGHLYIGGTSVSQRSSILEFNVGQSTYL